MRLVSNKLLQYGVTSFCPTIVTSARETYHQVGFKILVYHSQNRHVALRMCPYTITNLPQIFIELVSLRYV